MADNKIPVEIEVRLDERSVGVSMDSLKARLKAQGKELGSAMTQGFKSGMSSDAAKEFSRINKQTFAEDMRMRQTRSIMERRDMELQRMRWAAEKQAAKDQLTLGQAIESRFRRIALLTTELTRAFFGLSAVIGGISLPAILGTKYLKDIEDAKVGMTGILVSMGQIEGKQLNWNQAMAVSSQMIKRLEADSLKYAVALDDLVNTFRSVLAPGLAAGMNLEEIQKVAAIGTLAVKSIGLDSRQVVQEIRDLVAGGIQAASSTLATSLSIKDADIKRWREAGTLFDELMNRMSGFAMAAEERSNTLSGIFEVLRIKIMRLFADEGGFGAIKNVLKGISDGIGKVNYETGLIEFNPKLIQTLETFYNVFNKVIGLVGKAIELFIEWHRVIETVAFVMIGKLLGGAVFSGLAKLVTSLDKVGSAMKAIAAAQFVSTIDGLAGVATATGSAQKATSGLMSWWNKLGWASRGGLIGMILFGLYEVADYFGIADQIFKSAENRAREAAKNFSNITKATDAELNLIKEQQKLEKMKSAKGEGYFDRIDVFGKVDALNESRMNKAIVAQERLTAAARARVEELKKEQQLDITAVEGRRGANAEKYFESEFQKMKTVEGVTAKHDADMAEMGKQHANLMLNLSRKLNNATTEEEKKAAQEQIRVQMDTYNKVASFKEKSYQEELGGLNKKASKESQKALRDFEKDQRKLAKDVSSIWVDVFGDTMSAGDKYTLEFAEKYSLAMKGLSDLKLDAKTPEQIEAVNELILKLGEAGKLAPVIAELKNFELAIKSIQDATDLKLGAVDLSVAQAGGGLFATESGQYAKKAIEESRLAALMSKRGELSTKPQIEETRLQMEALDKAIQATQITIANLGNTLDKSVGRGAKDAWETYIDNATDAAAATKNLLTDAFKASEDALVSFVKTGKLEFGSFVNSVLDGLIRMASQAAIANIGQMMGFGSSRKGDTANDITSTGFSFLKNLWPFANGGAFGTDQISKYAKGAMFGAALATTPMAFANGGVPTLDKYVNSVVTSPTVFKFGTGVMGEKVGSPGEAILPLTRLSGGDLGVKATTNDSGNNVVVNVSVVVNSDGSSQTNINSQGMGKGMGDMIGSAVKGVIMDELRPGGLLAGKR